MHRKTNRLSLSAQKNFSKEVVNRQDRQATYENKSAIELKHFKQSNQSEREASTPVSTSEQNSSEAIFLTKRDGS